ncbi:hypothetical protein PAMA_020855 [Pampus argenteus]
MAASDGPEPGVFRVVVLLLGEKKSGKSSAGNTILGRQAFQKKTTHSSSEDGSIFGKQVTVVDTPGWLSHSTTPARVSQELCRGLTLCHPEPDVILLVMPTTATFGQEEWRAMQTQLALLHIPIWQRAIVLFTHGDKLGSLPIQEHIRQQGRTLHWLLERCGNKYQVMSSQSGASKAHVTELFEKIQKVMKAKKRPMEVQQRMYTQLRQEVKEERRWQGRQEAIEMTVMYNVTDGRPRQAKQVASGLPYMRRGFPAGSAVLKPALCLILLGRRKSGKSSAGNMILDRGEFQIDTKTSRCSVGHKEVSGWYMTVVDTPGWSLFSLTNPEQIKAAIGQSLSFCPPGSKVAFLLAVPVDSFKEKDRRAVEKYLSVLGEGVWRSTVVLFTYGDQLRGRAVEKLIKKRGEPLQWVLDRCGHRHCVFDPITGEETQVTQLLEMVEQL